MIKCVLNRQLENMPLRVCLAMVCFFATPLFGQSFQPIEIKNQNAWQPQETGALYFVHETNAMWLKKAIVEIEVPLKDLFLAIQQIHKAAIRYGANSFYPRGVTVDSVTGKIFYNVTLFALNQFDIDKLPYLPNGLYVLNPSLHTNGRSKEVTGGGYGTVIETDTFLFIPNFQGPTLRLDGEMGAVYKWKKRKLESDFVFSTRGSTRKISYRTPFSKKSSIYVSLTEPLGSWYLFTYGFEWWLEDEPIVHEPSEQK
jgi:hypothetical protein